MSSFSLEIGSLHLGIAPSPSGLPQQSPESLQDWISQTAKSRYLATPRFDPPQLAPPLMGALLKVQGS